MKTVGTTPGSLTIVPEDRVARPNHDVALGLSQFQLVRFLNMLAAGETRVSYVLVRRGGGGGRGWGAVEVRDVQREKEVKVEEKEEEEGQGVVGASGSASGVRECSFRRSHVGVLISARADG